MSYQRLAYEDAASASQMAADCAEVGRELRLRRVRMGSGSRVTAGTAADRPAPGSLDVSPRLAAIAAGLELHFA